MLYLNFLRPVYLVSKLQVSKSYGFIIAELYPLKYNQLLLRGLPRAAAVAERLWSSSTVNSTTEAAPRLEELRCNLIKRGFKVEPVNGPGYCECDYLV
ncbi:beta-hexosaminidase subunit alpha [Trichonephila clavipes]|nr:beta-hexosaminidase subunit alpha [Trichonephila clavipes]